jgi:menaquinone-9 beta-reductase
MIHARPFQRARYDVLVVGARCAGAATAMLLARRGLRVLVVDRGRAGQDTLSTHALMRGGVAQLHRWGVLDAIVKAGTPAITRTSFHYGDDTVEVQIRSKQGISGLYAPRRTVLDVALVNAARAAGAEVRYGMRLVTLRSDASGRVTGCALLDDDGRAHEVEAGTVVGADGLHSSVATLVGAPKRFKAWHAAAFDYVYFSGLENRGFNWYYRPGLSAGAIPTNDGLTCVFTAAPPLEVARERGKARVRGYYDRLARVAPELSSLVGESTRHGSLFRFPGVPGFLRQAFGPGWALVGDAGYFKDPITAHGITDALRDAELLARALADGRPQALEGYQAMRDDLSRRFLEITDAIASFEWSLDEVGALHRASSEEMKREVATLDRLERQAQAEPQLELR